MIVSTAHGQDMFVYERVAEAAVEAWGGRVFGLCACLGDSELVNVTVFGEGDVDEGHIHVVVCVARMF